MIRGIIEFSARNRVLVLLGVGALCVFAFHVLHQIRLDALPDLSDTQVIVYSRWDRSPDIVEDQVTYPIVSALLGAPRVKAVRGFSDFGYSFVYVIFQDGTDLYWARSRVLEYLSKIQSRLPEGVQTELGPDATGVGWVYQYALVDREKTILAANAKDVKAARAEGADDAFIDRPKLTAKGVEEMAEGLRQIARLPDPVGEITDLRYRPSGIQVGRMRVPLGVVGIIYESRPDVTADAGGLCLKSGNAAILRGGSESLHSNLAIAACLHFGFRRDNLIIHPVFSLTGTRPKRRIPWQNVSFFPLLVTSADHLSSLPETL